MIYENFLRFFLQIDLTKFVIYVKLVVPLKRALFLYPIKREVSPESLGKVFQNNPTMEVPL